MTPAERLADAEAKYHQLLTGTLARVYVDQNGERIEYTSANAGRLSAYIQRLRQQVGSSGAGGTGPMGIIM